jgi:hypothetical protein
MFWLSRSGAFIDVILMNCKVVSLFLVEKSCFQLGIDLTSKLKLFFKIFCSTSGFLNQLDQGSLVQEGVQFYAMSASLTCLIKFRMTEMSKETLIIFFYQKPVRFF